MPKLPRALVALLVAAWIARVALAACGGQLFNPDESFRFSRPYQFMHALGEGRPGEAATRLLQADHVLFGVVSLAPAIAHKAWCALTGARLDDTLWVPAQFFVVPSVGVILMVWLLAVRLGASEGEALLAAFLAACSSSLFYYSRSFFPYDLSMLAALYALWLALDDDAPCMGRCGVALAVSFLLWYPSILLVNAVAVLAALRLRRRPPLLVALGAFSAVCAVALGLLAAANPETLARAGAFMGSTQQQSAWSGATPEARAEGPTHLFAWLWSAEHGLVIVWLLGAAVVVAGWIAHPRRLPLDAGRTGVLGAALVYGQVAVASALLHVLVPMARFERPVVPFLCLAAAAGLIRLAAALPGRRALAWTLVVAVTVQAVVSFAPSYRLWFPRDVMAICERAHGPLRLAWTVEGVPPQGAPTSHWVLLNASFIWPLLPPAPRPAGAEVAAYPHPLQTFVPFQYDHYTPTERHMMEHTDLTMRLIETDRP